MADWFAAVRGRRKAILFFSEGIDYDINDLIPGAGSNHGSATMILDETRDTIASATRSNVAIYGIDPRGLTDLGDETIELGAFPDDTSLGIGQSSIYNEIRLAQDSLRTLSEETGGFAVVNRNDFTTSFDRIVRDNSYVLRPRVLSAGREAGPRPQDRCARHAPWRHGSRAQGVRDAEEGGPAEDQRQGHSDARDSRGGRQPAARQRADDARVRRAVQGRRAERIGAARHRDARARI